MSNKLVSIGFGEVARTLADSISGMVNDSVDKKMKSYDAEYEAKVQKLVDNANAEYDKQAKELEHKITDGIEQAKAQAEVVKQEISAKVTEKINAANQANKNEIVEEFRARYNGIEVNMQGLKATTDQLKTSDADIQKLINDFKTQTQSQFVGVQGAQSRFEQTTEKAISDLINVANGKADRSYVEQTVNGIKEQLTSSTIGGPNLIRDTAYKEGTKYFGSNGIAKIGNHPFYFNGSKPILIFSNNDQTEKVISSNRFLLEKNTDYTLNFRGFNNSALTSYDVYILGRRNGETQGFTIIKQLINGKKLSTSELESVSVQFNSGDIDNAYLRFDNNGTNGGQSDLYIAEIDLYKGTQKRPWQPALEDQEYLVTQAQATFERTIQGLSTQLTKLETKTGPTGELEQRMLTYSEKAAVDALKATRQILEQGYVAKSQYTEDVAGINRKFETISTLTDSKISSKLAEFKQGIDGQFSTFSTEFGMRLSSQNSVINDKLDDFKDSINGRFANYQSTVNGQVATIVSQLDGVLKKTDINITDGQISFGTGKTINGRTISSLLVQEPEAIALIAKLIKVKGDMVVDGSITSRHLASQSVRTGHMEAGSVTTQILASNAVTADKLLVDSAMINKLISNQAFIRELTSQKAFITQLASIDFSAERIKGGRLESNTGALVFDLDSSAMNMLTDTAVIRRVFNNFPTQFIRYGTHIENGNRFSKTIIGSNRDGTENSGNRTFSGIEIYNSTNEDVEDYTKFYADKLYLQHSEYKQGWIIQNAGKPRIAPLNGTTYSEIIASDFRMIYTADGNHRSVGTYLWDLLTCFGILQKYGWDLKNSAAQRHIGSVLSKYNYR